MPKNNFPKKKNRPQKLRTLEEVLEKKNRVKIIEAKANQIEKSKTQSKSIIQNPLNFFQKLNQSQKRFIAVSLTFLFISGTIFAYFLQTNKDFRNSVLLITPEEIALQQKQDALIAGIIESNNNIDLKTPDQILYQDVPLEDLPVYPQPWVERHFTPVEQRNTLISGPSSDPDGDGLANKFEYFNGSDPKNPYTLCGTNQGEDYCSLNDGENVENKISPLTGFPIEVQPVIRIRKQDNSVLKQVEDTFETAAKEGVDFPTLYQVSKTLDLSSDLEAIEVLSQPDNRESYLSYNEFRLDLTENILNSDEFGGLSEVYKYVQVENLETLKKRYVDQLEETKKVLPPETFVQIHKGYILLFQKLIELIDHRIVGLQAGDIYTDEFLEKSKDIASQVVWAYRYISEEGAKLPNIENL